MYGVLFDRTFVRNIFHASKYLASYAVNASSNAQCTYIVVYESTIFDQI